MTGLVLSCEHASWLLPHGIDLGLDDDTLQGQAGWDHGALEIAERLGEALGIIPHVGLFTRTFVDLNRPPTHPDAVPVTCYGVVIPGNQQLSDDDRAARLANFHHPYWDAVRREARARLRDSGHCLHLSVHSFSPDLDPAQRTFDVGVLFDDNLALEVAIADRMQFALVAAGFSVRRNQPYSGADTALVTSLRSELAAHGVYAGLELEASHAVTMTPDGCARIAAALAPVLEALRNE